MIESQVSLLTAPYELEFQSEILNVDEMAPHEILCETLVSAISPGTEVAAYTGLAALRPGKIYPRLVGYCNVARVLRCGNGVEGINVGDRVLTFSCHRTHFIITQDEVLSLIPDKVSSEHASCAYLYHLGYDAMLKSHVRYGSPVVVIGLGVLGLGAVAMSVNAGADVYVVSDQEVPVEKALKMGAKGAFDRSQLAELELELGNRLADVVITTSCAWDDWKTSLQLAGDHGTIAVVGFPGRGIDNIPFNPLDSQYFYSKQLRIQAVGLSPEQLDSRHFLKFNEKTNLVFLLNQIACGNLNPELLITGAFPWHQLKDAYEALISRENSPITYILQWKN